MLRPLFKTLDAFAKHLDGRAEAQAQLLSYAKTWPAPHRVERSASLRVVAPWHRLGELSTRAMLWEGEGAGASSRGGTELNPEFFRVVDAPIKVDVSLDLRCIDGLAAARESLDACESLEEFAAKHCTSELGAGKSAREILASSAVRCTVDGTVPRLSADSFVWHQWDQRWFFANCSGAPEIAAAKQLSMSTGEEVTVSGQGRLYAVSPGRVLKIAEKFDMFWAAEPTDQSSKVAPQKGPGTKIFATMDKLGAAWGHVEMSSSDAPGFILLLPKHSERSRKVAAALREAGVVELGAYLLSIAARPLPRTQHRIAFTPPAPADPSAMALRRRMRP